jgi:hypothetical protein
MNLPDLPEASRSRVALLHGCILCAYDAAIDAPVTVIHIVG